MRGSERGGMSWVATRNGVFIACMPHHHIKSVIGPDEDMEYFWLVVAKWWLVPEKVGRRC